MRRVTRSSILLALVIATVLAALVLAPAAAFATGANGPAPASPPSTQTYSPLPSTGLPCMGLVDPLTVDPQTVYDFSTDVAGSRPTTFPGGTFSTIPATLGYGIRVVGTDWSTWNPQTAGKHILYVPSQTIRFTTPQQAVGVVAESMAFGLHNVTIEAYNTANKLIGQFTRSIDGNGGAAFLGLGSPNADISYVQLYADTSANGFAYSDLTYGGNLATFLSPLRPQDPKIFMNSWPRAGNLWVRYQLSLPGTTGLARGLQTLPGQEPDSLTVLGPSGAVCFTGMFSYNTLHKYYECTVAKGIFCSWPWGMYTLVVDIGGAIYQIPIQIGLMTMLR
jgi:hypothetical protein